MKTNTDREKGQAVVEYLLATSFVTLAMVAAIKGFGTILPALIRRIGDVIAPAVP